MRKLSANYIFPVSSAPLKNGILILDEQNCIVDLIDTKGKVKEIENLEFYSGIIVPGFVDVFTLLGFPNFTQNDFLDCAKLNFGCNLKEKLLTKEVVPEIMQRGINQLEAFGTVAVADYYLNDSFSSQKQKSKLCFQDLNLIHSKPSLQIPFANEKFEPDASFLLNHILLEKLKSRFLLKKDTNAYCIGTGSLGMTQKLSVFNEIKTLQQLLPELSLWDLVECASLNGAKHLGIDKEFGSFEMGKKPGVNLLTHLDYRNEKFNPNSELKVLVS